ncbi:GntR family transcriptional regulator [Marispirochaeta sp.]|jgi:DNA-binding GntR family transcriptional regulator|uniref:GntR family transcriptional regulator n=1 Tax=Marispirochaeta sp. TaxID=2038653 RepID=UPI0029C85434|nr:GntR family transcriptional regulator [Marispirochaeta sp.]
MLKQIVALPMRERVASELRNAIFSGKFGPGYELRQDYLANKFGVSRMPVREALYILSGEGLVKLRANKGAIVKNITKDFVREHFELRLILECEAIARACQFTEDISELEYIHAQQKKAIDSLDMVTTGECNQALHMVIWKNAKNTKMESLLEHLWNGLSTGIVVTPQLHAKESYDEHSLMIKAIKEKNPELGREVMKKHITRSMENMLMGISNNQAD